MGDDICGEISRQGWICRRPPNHEGVRHRYARPVVPPPIRAWEPVLEFSVWNEPKTRQYAVKVGRKCGIFAYHPSGQNSHNWKIASAERNVETGRVNVSVIQPSSGRSRTFPADRIIYKRK